MEKHLNNIPLWYTCFLPLPHRANISFIISLNCSFSVVSIIVLNACILLKLAFFNKYKSCVNITISLVVILDDMFPVIFCQKLFDFSQSQARVGKVLKHISENNNVKFFFAS